MTHLHQGTGLICLAYTAQMLGIQFYVYTKLPFLRFGLIV